jgi:quinol monooxygenase YgiN
MFNQIVKFNVKPEYREEFQTALLENQKATSLEGGNLEMRLYVDNQDPNLFFAYDRWVNREALESHILQPYAQKLVNLAEIALAKPVEILNLSETSPAPVALKDAAPEDEKFNIIFIFKIKPEFREQLLDQFKEHISQTRTEKGCLLFDLYTVDGAEDTLAVYEHWRKESDVWDIHFHQPYSKITGALMEKAVVGDMRQYMNFVTQIA